MAIEDAITERRPLLPRGEGSPAGVQVTERPDVQAPAAPALAPPPPWPPPTGEQLGLSEVTGPSSLPSSRAPAGKGVVVRADGTERRRTTIYLPPTLARRLAMHCAGEGVEMSEVAAQALEAWLSARGA